MTVEAADNLCMGYNLSWSFKGKLDKAQPPYPALLAQLKRRPLP
jgi:hypothetical protein